MSIRIKPILTEKSLAEAKRGKYTFNVPKNLSKFQIKEVISKLFDVNVVSVNTMTKKATEKMSANKKKVRTSATKKAIVKLADKQTISLFGEEKKSKAKA